MVRASLVAVFATLGLAAGVAQADSQEYEEAEVSDGGSIVGRVVFAGTPPAPEKLVVNTDMEICGKKEKFSQALLVASNRGVKNAVVHLRDVRKGKKWAAQKHQLAQTGCEFDPHVLLLSRGADLHLVNTDRIAHSVRSHAEDFVFNIGQPKFVVELLVPDFAKKVTEQNVITLGCDIHKWMRAYVVVQRHPYYALTDESGSFQITAVPPGQYALELWHESLGQKRQEVTVKPKAETTVTFELEGTGRGVPGAGVESLEGLKESPASRKCAHPMGRSPQPCQMAVMSVSTLRKP